VQVGMIGLGQMGANMVRHFILSIIRGLSLQTIVAMVTDGSRLAHHGDSTQLIIVLAHSAAKAACHVRLANTARAL
jgi:6-phosphogluconate dehydrogenase (decarboxylating)